MFVREADHRRVLSLLEVAAASNSRAELTARLLPGLRTLFHADETSHTAVLATTGQVVSATGYPTPGSARPAALSAYEARPLEHPWVAHVVARHSGGSVRLSDLTGRHDLRRTQFYQDFYRPRGIEHADYQAVSWTAGEIVGFCVSRSRRDFAADEHDLFEHLRRPLGRIWQLVARVEALETPAGTAAPWPHRWALTPAEQRVSVLVLRGWRTDAVARDLQISTKAVEQHLTRIYRKAQVSSRAEYVARSLTAPSGESP